MSAEQEAAAPAEHLNIKVTDNNNEVFFKIKRSTQLKKLMDAFCERQGKQSSTVRFLFDGTRVRPEDTPDTVRPQPQQAEESITDMRSSTWPMATLSRFIKSRSVVDCAH